jgi:hypothetical protein
MMMIIININVIQLHIFFIHKMTIIKNKTHLLEFYKINLIFKTIKSLGFHRKIKTLQDYFKSNSKEIKIILKYQEKLKKNMSFVKKVIRDKHPY